MADRAENPFDARTIGWLIMAAAIAFAGFLFFSAYAPEIKPKSMTAFAPMSKSAIGFTGLIRLLDETGEERVAVLEDNEALTEPGLVLMPLALETNAASIRGFAEERARRVPGGATLFVLPKWRTMPLGWRGDRVQRVAALDLRALDTLTKPIARTVAVFQEPSRSARITGLGISPPVPADPLTFVSKVEPLVMLGDRNILLGRVTDIAGGPVYVLSDPDLLTNHGLKTWQGALAALALIRRVQPAGDNRISIDPEPARGDGANQSRNLLQLMFEPPFLAVTIALLIAAALAGWHAFGRFGPVEPDARAIPFGKRALVDNATLLLARAGRIGRLGERYVAVVRDRLASDLGIASLPADAIDARFAALTPAGFSSYDKLVAEAGAATTAEELRAAAAALHHWKDSIRDRR